MDAPTSPQEIVAAARAAKQAGKIDEALQHWARFRAEYPARPLGYLRAIEIAQSVGQSDLANVLIFEGAKRLPNKAELVELRRALSPTALERAERQLSNGELSDFRRAQDEGGRLLDAALAPTQVRRPNKVALSTALGVVEALESKFPRRIDMRAACLRLLRSLQQYSDGRERGRAWLPDHADDIPFVLLVAELFDKADDLSAAYDVVQALRTRVGSNPAVDAALIAYTARIPDVDVESVCARALADHPRNALVLREWAVVAQRQGNWDEALKRWETAARIAPNPLINHGLGACRLQLATDQAVDQTDIAKFYGSFSSLGGTAGGCEFGMIQRRYGSKALGLFRWSNIPAEDLIRGLNTDFAGLGQAETTELTTSRDKAGLVEYMVQDRAYNSSSHTLIYTKDAPAEKVREQTMRRLGYLKDGLLDQLRKPDKIFIYKFVGKRGKSEDLIQKLGTAIRKHGPGKLVCLVLADREAQRGTVSKLDDGLYVGFLDSMMGKDGAPEGGFDELGWKGVCSAVLSDVSGTQMLPTSSKSPVLAANSQAR